MDAHELAGIANTLRMAAEHVDRVARGSEPSEQWRLAEDARQAYQDAARLYWEAIRMPSNTTSAAHLQHWQIRAIACERDAGEMGMVRAEADRQLHHAISTTNEQAERMGR